MQLFLSYRRNDSLATARAMKEFLDGVPRVKRVFLDFDAIPPGSPDFVAAIDGALAKADTAIVLIGPDWAGRRPDGSLRIQDTDDHVRREVARALTSGRKLLPVLIDGAPMPEEASLPDDLKPLCRVNAVPLRSSQFRDDMVRLLNAASGKPGKGLDFWKRRPMTFIGAVIRLLLGAGLAAALLIGVLAWFDASAAARNACGTLNCLMAQVAGGLTEAEASAMPGATLTQKYMGLAMIFCGGVVLTGAALPFLWRAVRR